MAKHIDGGDPGRTARSELKQWLGQSHPTNAPLGKLRGFWGHCPTLFLAAGLAFDPHILLLAWPDARQETVAATSRATCTAAIGSIIAGRWLADDPPAVMRCERGSAFAPGSDCIASYNCGQRR